MEAFYSLNTSLISTNYTDRSKVSPHNNNSQPTLSFGLTWVKSFFFNKTFAVEDLHHAYFMQTEWYHQEIIRESMTEPKKSNLFCTKDCLFTTDLLSVQSEACVDSGEMSGSPFYSVLLETLTLTWFIVVSLYYGQCSTHFHPPQSRVGLFLHCSEPRVVIYSRAQWLLPIQAGRNFYSLCIVANGYSKV